ncbi:SAM-dependent methyltransferase [Actinophytocola glycyrrhizae]|uniref:SAM-dependent methyltransferase n=1 Tax=Actinophytocola glycyrrhizae TaxID=2044873 RepID=A0ABV9RYD3_9PSEU
MEQSPEQRVPRGREEVLRLFGDFELIGPGLVTTSQWRPDLSDDVEEPRLDGLYAGVACKRS